MTRTTTNRGRPAWGTTRRIIGAIFAIVIAAALGTSGILAQASEEPPGGLRSEPESGPAPMVFGEGAADWATFIADGECPSDMTHARGYVIFTDGVTADMLITGTAAVTAGSEARVTTALTWPDLRGRETFAASTSHTIGIRCGTSTMPASQWRTLPVRYQGTLNYNNDEANPTWAFNSSTPGATPTTVSVATFVDGAPASEVTAGTPLEVRATVTPAEAAGDVELFDIPIAALESLGSATVSGGTATFTLDDLAVGEYNLTAIFTPDDPEAYEKSPQATQQVLTVVAADAERTTTTLAVAPQSPVQVGDEVTLTATVAPSGAAGDVRFEADGEPVGDAVAVSGGTATLTTTQLPEGVLDLTAAFGPADPAAFRPSTSSPVSYTVEGDAPEDPRVTAIDAEGNALGDNPTLEDGQVVTLSAPGYAADEDVTVTLDPEGEEPLPVGDPIAADAEGTVRTAFTATGIAAGQHELALAGADQTLTWRFQLAEGTGEEDGTEDGEEDGTDAGTEDGTDDGTDAGTEDGGAEDGGAAGGDAGGAGGAAGGAAGGSGGPSGGLAQTGAFLVGPALLLGIAAVGAGYAFIRRSREDDLLTFDEASS